MKKLKILLKKVLTSKALLIPVAMVAIVAGAAGFTAFEAHVINVTAKIENALGVTQETPGLDFGTVFPQEEIVVPLDVSLSSSFLAQGRVDTVNYVINQKPKCQDALGNFGRVKEDEAGGFVCADSGFEILPILCPFLSKDSDGGDQDVPAFHGPIADWEVADTLANQASATLSNPSDLSDSWDIDLAVPCFENQCSEDWPLFVQEHNPLADPDAYILPGSQESKLHGCDLWVEVTGIPD